MAGLDFPRTPGSELVLHSDPDIPAFDVNYAVEDVMAALAILEKAGCRVMARFRSPSATAPSSPTRSATISRSWT
jgi:hypothetical protein